MRTSEARNSGRRWTPPEERGMLEVWLKTGRIAAVARYLGRTELAIMNRLGSILASSLNDLSGDSPTVGGRRASAAPINRFFASYTRWTPYEDGVLRENCLELSEETAQLLDRSEGAIRSRLRKLGLPRDEDWMPDYELEERDARRAQREAWEDEYLSYEREIASMAEQDTYAP